MTSALFSIKFFSFIRPSMAEDQFWGQVDSQNVIVPGFQEN